MSSVKKTSYNVNSIIGKYIMTTNNDRRDTLFGTNCVKLYKGCQRTKKISLSRKIFVLRKDIYATFLATPTTDYKLLLTKFLMKSNKYYQAFARNDF